MVLTIANDGINFSNKKSLSFDLDNGIKDVYLFNPKIENMDPIDDKHLDVLFSKENIKLSLPIGRSELFYKS